jgi:DNA polymerase-3 subunit delta
VLAFLKGADAWAAERAITELARELGTDGAAGIRRWRGAEVDLDELGERLATQPLFGGGTLAVVEDPTPLLRSSASRYALSGALGLVAPGNGLALVALDEPGGRRPAALDQLERLVAERGGRVLAFPPPTRERMHAFIAQRAAELGVTIDQRATRALAERVGAWVREGDVDRRRQAQLAAAEVEKLALYRPGGRIGLEDVEALVAEAVPGSTWAFLDAVAERRTAEASTILRRLLDEGVPLQVLIAQLHRRLRSLVEVQELLTQGVPVTRLPRALKVQPYRAERLARQARAWSAEETERALEGLLELDVLSKGLEGAAPSEAGQGLALELWLLDRARAS